MECTDVLRDRSLTTFANGGASARNDDDDGDGAVAVLSNSAKREMGLLRQRLHKSGQERIQLKRDYEVNPIR